MKEASTRSADSWPAGLRRRNEADPFPGIAPQDPPPERWASRVDPNGELPASETSVAQTASGSFRNRQACPSDAQCAFCDDDRKRAADRWREEIHPPRFVFPGY